MSDSCYLVKQLDLKIVLIEKEFGHTIWMAVCANGLTHILCENDFLHSLKSAGDWLSYGQMV